MTDDPEFVMVRRDKLEAVAKWFREYEASHAAKGNLDGDLKARRNAERAEFVEALISAAPPAPSVSEEMAYRERSRQIEAWQWNGQPKEDWPVWLGVVSQMLPGLERGWFFVRQPAADRAHAIPEKDFWKIYEAAALSPKPMGEEECIGTGWAVLCANDQVDLRTVAQHRRAAIINWLVVGAGWRVTQDWRDSLIERTWQHDAKKHGVRVEEIRIFPAIAAIIQASGGRK
jgi:hypothetical protein